MPKPSDAARAAGIGEQITTSRIATRMRSIPPVGSRVLGSRIEAARERGVDVLPLMPYAERAAEPHVMEAVEREMRRNREAPPRGLLELRAAVAAYIGDEIGRRVDGQTEVLISNGAMQALNLMFRAILNPGDEVIIPSPCYFFGGCVELAGGIPVHVPMDEADGFAWNIERIAAAITPRSVAIVVSSPVNPTGVVLTEDVLTAIVKLADERDLLIVSDESYDTMVYDGARHVCVAGLPGPAERIVLIRSFTKSFAMPAWRVGYIVGPPDIIGACAKALEWEQLHSTHLAQAAAAAVMDGPREFQTQMTSDFQRARDTIYPLVRDIPGLQVKEPAGGPFLFCNVSQVFASSEDASSALLEAGVPTTPGHYCQSDQHVRMAFGASLEVLKEAAQRIEQVIAGQPAQSKGG